MTRHSVAISGSFRRHLDGIMETARQFADLGIDVLSPRISKAIKKNAPFVLLESDDSSNPEILEQRHLEAIAAADALYVYNRDGYFGYSTTLELGWAVALAKPIFCREQVADTTLKIFCKQVATPADVLKELQNRSPLDAVSDRSSVTAMQLYVRDMVRRRSFHEETPQDVLLLLLEEVGELAKAVRKYIGLKVDEKKSSGYPPLSDEIADVFIYLLHLANLTGTSVFEAFYNKEQKNQTRHWENTEHLTERSDPRKSGQ
jgi:NTP pyrophosphatase (non-canonical NTP hydrolase)